jgi:hypothetical protein
VSGQLHARPIYPQGKSPLYPLDTRQGGPQSGDVITEECGRRSSLRHVERSVVQLGQLRAAAVVPGRTHGAESFLRS